MPSGNVIFKKLSASDLQELAEISKRTFKEAFGADNNPEDLQLYLDSVMGEENLRRSFQILCQNFTLQSWKGKPWVISKSI